MGFFAVPPVVVTIFAYLHVISAMGWVGGAILFASTIAPSLRGLGPATSLEFIAKVIPRVSNYFILIATSTVIFGPLVLLTIPDESPLIYVGAATALTAYIAVILVTRLFKRAAKIANEMLMSSHPGPPPAEFQRALNLGGMGVTTILVLLVVTLLFMIYSGYPF